MWMRWRKNKNMISSSKENQNEFINKLRRTFLIKKSFKIIYFFNLSSRRITNGRFVLFSSFKSTPSEKWNHRTFNAKIVIFLYCTVCVRVFFFGHSFGWLFSNEFLVNFVCIWNDVIYVHQNAFALSFYPFDSGQCQTQIMLLMMMMMVYAHSVIKYER